MADEEKDFYADYDVEEQEEVDLSGSFIDSDRDYPIEPRCCITGEEVKHSFCRYPDPVHGTMMIMSRDVMLRFSRKGHSLSEEFERVIALRRKQESSGKKGS